MLLIILWKLQKLLFVRSQNLIQPDQKWLAHSMIRGILRESTTFSQTQDNSQNNGTMQDLELQKKVKSVTTAEEVMTSVFFFCCCFVFFRWAGLGWRNSVCGLPEKVSKYNRCLLYKAFKAWRIKKINEKLALRVLYYQDNAPAYKSVMALNAIKTLCHQHFWKSPLRLLTTR